MLAERYHWTPAQIADMDPDYIAELLARIRAENDQEAAGKKRKSKQPPTRRVPGGYLETVDAEVE